MPPVLTKNGDRLEIALGGCRGMEFQDAKEKVKSLPGRQWDPESKNWIVMADPMVAERIVKTIRPEVSDELLNWITASKASYEGSLTASIPDDAKGLAVPWAYRRAPWQPTHVNDEPYNGLLPWQRSATAAIVERRRAILADDMGLGKTLECISAVEEYALRNGQLEGPKLVVAPSSVKGAWARELHRWLEDPSVAIIDGGPVKRHDALVEAIENNAWCIVNWEQLRVKKERRPMKNGGYRTVTVMKEPLFEKTEWLAIIADEVHRAKNRKAQQAQGLHRLQSKGLMIGATGTPLMNSPDELWSILRWLWPDQYHETGMKRNATAYWDFYEDFVDYWEDHFQRKIVTGVKNPDALRFALKDKLIRRTSAVLGLKGKKRIYYGVSLTPKQQKLYDEAETAMWLAVEEDIAAGNKQALEFATKAVEGEAMIHLWNLPNGAARMVRLQQIIESPTLLGGPDDSAIMDDFEEKYLDSRPEPWVFFFKFKKSCDLFAERLRSRHGATVGVYHGDVRPVDRTKLEDRFQRGEIDVMVGTVDAMKEGITLTRSHLMGFASRSCFPDVNELCESRLDRLGQQQLVRVYIPQAEETVATGRVEPINRLKEGIVRTILPKQDIQEVNV